MQRRDILIVFLFYFFNSVIATHYRFGYASWTPTQGTYRIVCDIQQAWRKTAWFGQYSNAIGGTFGVGSWAWGDGTSFSMKLTVTAHDSANDWMVGVVTATKAYAAANSGGNAFQPEWSSCCRISTLQNNRDGSMRLYTTVDLRTWPGTSWINSPPNTNALPIMQLYAGITNYVQFFANDPDGETISYQLCSYSEWYGSTHPSGLTISTSGLITWATPNSVGSLYCSCAVLSDGKAQVMVDFIIEIIQQTKKCSCGTGNAKTCLACTADSTCCGTGTCISNRDPTFVSPSPWISGTLASCFVVGVQSTFVIKASDLDTCDTVLIQSGGLPSGALLTNTPGGTNPNSQTFTWTPTTAQAGTQPVACFVARDNAGGTSTQSCNNLYVPPASASPPTVSSFTPTGGEAISNTAVSISGSNFYRGNNLMCQFKWAGVSGTTMVAAVWVSASGVICIVPQKPVGATSSDVTIEVSNYASCNQWTAVTSSTKKFTYYASCPPGTAGPGCTSCASGRYQSGGSGPSDPAVCLDCPAGKYGNTFGLLSPLCTGECNAGYYCLAASTSQFNAACPAGTYGSSTGLTGTTCSGQCSAGYYCPSGSTISSPYMCGGGRYGGAGQVGSMCAGSCAAGYYCPAGSASPTQNQCGSAAVFCPIGSSGTIPVSDGYYSTGGATVQTKTNQEQCEPGYYCVSGIRTSCPAGRYGSEYGLILSTCTGPCTQGFYCPVGSSSPTAQECGALDLVNPQNWYCPAGSTARLSVTSGYYSLSTSDPSGQRYDQAICTADYICINGTRSLRIQYTQGCTLSGNNYYGSFSQNENGGSTYLGRIIAVSNQPTSPTVAYSIVSVTRGVSCTTSNEFTYATVSGGYDITLNQAVNYEKCPSYVITLRSTAGIYSKDCAITVSVNDINDCPVISPTTIARSINENSQNGTYAGNQLAGRECTDEDAGNEFQFNITSGNTNDVFRIGPCSGQVAVNNDILNYEATNSYTLGVMVTDSGRPVPCIRSATIVVSVLDINEAPYFIKSSYNMQIEENVLPGTGLKSGVSYDLGPLAADPDIPTPASVATISYMLTEGSPPFNINPSTGIITLAAGSSIDYETSSAGTIAIGVRVTDSLLTVEKIFAITIIDVNDAPIITGSSYAVSENSAIGTNVGETINCIDQDSGASLSFSITGGTSGAYLSVASVGGMPLSGQLKVASNIDYETIQSMIVNVTVSDNGHNGYPIMSKWAIFSITVLDVNEAPYFTGGLMMNFNENVPIGFVVGTVTAADPDTLAGQTLSFSIVTGHLNRFAISSSGVLTTALAIDFEARSWYNITVRVTDNGSPPKYTDSIVQVLINDLNEPPTFPSGRTLTLVENSVSGTTLSGGPITGTDPDVGQTAQLVYSITNANAAALFTVSNSGVFQVKSGVIVSPHWLSQLNYDNSNSFSLNVQVTDPFNLNGSSVATVALTNVNEPPNFPEASMTVSENSPSGRLIGVLQGWDADLVDANAMTYVVTGALPASSPACTSLFTVVGTQLRTNAVIPATGAPPYGCNVTIQVTDSVANQGIGYVWVEITVQNDPPSIPPTFAVTVREDTAAGFVLINNFQATDTSVGILTFSRKSVLPVSGSALFQVTSAFPGTMVLSQAGLDFESQASYVIEVEVADNGPGTLKNYTAVTVIVSDVNEPPTVVSDGGVMNVNETSPALTTVGTVVIYDPDSPETFTYSIAAKAGFDMQGLDFPFQISAAGVIQIKSGTTNPLNTEAKPYYDVTVSVTDGGIRAGGGPGAYTRTGDIRIMIDDINEPPTSSPSTSNVNEDALLGSVVALVAASDPDDPTKTWGMLTYAITNGNSEGRFSVSSTGGIVLDQTLDFENVILYTLTVRVSDGGVPSLFVDATVTINVLNINDVVESSIGGFLIHGTSGSDTLFFGGSNLGPTTLKGGSTTITATATNILSIVYTMTCTQSMPNTAVACTTIPGVGANLAWVLTVDGYVASATPQFSSYAAPIITSVNGVSALPTAGGQTITINGANFGPMGTSIAVTYQGSVGFTTFTAQSCSVTTAHVTITCTSAVGSGVNLQWTVTIAGQSNLIPYTSGSYASPTITSIHIDTATGLLDTRGLEMIHVNGTNFGDSNAMRQVFYGPSEYNDRKYWMSCVIMVPHTKLGCTSRPGVGHHMMFDIQVSSNDMVAITFMPSSTVSYVRPSVTRVDGDGAHLAKTVGGQEIFITGDMFGPIGDSDLPMFWYGPLPSATRYTASNCEVITPSTRIRCFTVAGTGKGHAWSLSIGNQSLPSPFPASTDYHPPVMSGYSGPGSQDAITDGGQIVFVSGSNFGPGDNTTQIELATYGNPKKVARFTSSCFIEIPHTLLRCNTVPGAGNQLEWNVTVDRQPSEASSTSYFPPSVTSISGAGASNAYTDGGQVIILGGQNFGPSDHQEYLEWVRFAPLGAGAYYDALNCMIQSHETIQCILPPGTGGPYCFQVRVRGQVSAQSASTFSYASPVLSQLTGRYPNWMPGYFDNSTQGGNLVQLIGTNFGINDPRSVIKLHFGTHSEVPSLTKTDSYGGVQRIQFILREGYGTGIKVYITATTPFGNITQSNQLTFDYKAPTITGTGSSRDENVPGYMFLDIFGKSFCRPDNTSGAAVTTSSVSSPFGQCASVTITPTAGSPTTYRMGDSNAYEFTHSHIQIYLPISTGSYSVNVAGRVTAVSTYSSTAPSFRADTCAGIPTNYDTRGYNAPTSQILSLAMEDICGTAVTVEAGGSACINPIVSGVLFTDPISLKPVCNVTCDVPPGEGKNMTVVVKDSNGMTANLGSSCKGAYARPVLTSAVMDVDSNGVPLGVGVERTVSTVTQGPPTCVRLSSIPTICSENVLMDILIVTPTRGGNLTIRGINLGTSVFADTIDNQLPSCVELQADGVIRLLDSAIAVKENDGLTHTHVQSVIQLPAGQGANWQIVPRVGLQLSPYFVGLRYETPTITGVTPTTGRTIGGYAITVSGTNFGMDVSKIIVSVGSFSCLNVMLMNHETLTCQLSAGQGSNLAIAVRVDGQVSSSSIIFTYLSPIVTSNSPTIINTPGGQSVWIVGDNFGIQTPTIIFEPTRTIDRSLTINMMLGGGESASTASRIIFFNHTHIRFNSPEGQGDVRNLRVQIASVMSAISSQMSFFRPTVTALFPMKGPAKGYTVALVGTNFGSRTQSTTLTGLQILITVPGGGSIECSNVGYEGTWLTHPDRTEWINRMSISRDYEVAKTMMPAEPTSYYTHTYYFCRMPTGFGQNIPYRVGIDGLDSGSVYSFSFTPPSVTRVSPSAPSGVRAMNPFSIKGESFGNSTFGNVVNVADAYFAEIHCDNTTLRADNLMECEAAHDTVGKKVMKVTVAGYTNVTFPNPADPSDMRYMIVYQCDYNFYGQIGEYCAICPKGGECPGRVCADQRATQNCTSYVEPFSRAGYWKIDLISNLCPDLRKERPYPYNGSCPSMIPCEPPAACIGNNVCGVGYTGDRCSVCVKGRYYRVNGECIPCPNNPAVLIVFFVLMVICLCIGGYILNRKKIHIAFVSIGVDYFQVLAMFANSKVQWPPFLKNLFFFFQIFNLNLEITAPECALPDLGYGAKWSFIMCLPLILGSVFLTLHIAKFIYGWYVLKLSSEKRNAHLPTLISMYMIMFYYLYLYLTRTIFDVFNCNPTDPPDGYEPGYLQAVFEPCYQPGGLHLRLLPWAIVCCFIYTFGYPIFVAYILTSNKGKVKVDQLLRAMGTGDSSITNPHFNFRNMYHKLYYHFKPGKLYWILIVISRKFMIAVAALMFRKTPAFQLAVVLLVLFIAYSLQVKHRPYMSMSERREIYLHHKQKVTEGNMKHKAIAAAYAKAQAIAIRKGRNTDMSRLAEMKRTPTKEFIVDYNTVEAVLLFCAVLVSLAGVMILAGNAESSYFTSQRDIITVLVGIVIVGSIIYFFIVFILELLGTFSLLGKQKKKSTKSKYKGKSTDKEEGVSLSMIDDSTPPEFHMNPMALQADQVALADMEASIKGIMENLRTPSTEEWRIIQSYHSRSQKIIDDLTWGVADQRGQCKDMKETAMKHIGAHGKRRSIIDRVLGLNKLKASATPIVDKIVSSAVEMSQKSVEDALPISRADRLKRMSVADGAPVRSSRRMSVVEIAISTADSEETVSWKEWVRCTDGHGGIWYHNSNTGENRSRPPPGFLADGVAVWTDAMTESAARTISMDAISASSLETGGKSGEI